MMQLILETEPSGDTMSIEVDTPVNGAIVELKNELNQANKENKLMEKDINIPEIITSATELNLDIIKETVLNADEIIENSRETEENKEIDNLTKTSNEQDDNRKVNETSNDKNDLKLSAVAVTNSAENKRIILEDENDLNIPAVTNNEENNKQFLENENDATADEESHVEIDIEKSNDINVAQNGEEAQVSSVIESIDDVMDEEIEAVNADINTNSIENVEELQELIELKEDNVLCVEPVLQNATAKIIEESSVCDTDHFLNKELTIPENNCANENKFSEATEEKVTDTSNDVISVETSDHEEIDDNILNDAPPSSDKSNDHLNILDKKQTSPINNDITENNAKVIMDVNEEMKEQIDISLEKHSAPTSEEKVSEDVIMDEEVKLVTADSSHEIENNETEKSLDADLEESFNVEDEEVLDETNNHLNGSLVNTETVTNPIEVTIGSDTTEKNEPPKTEANSEENKESPDVEVNNLNMDIDIPEVSETVKEVCERKIANSEDNSLNTISQANDTKEVLGSELENSNIVSGCVDLENNLNDNAQKDIADYKKMETESNENVQIIDDDINIIEDDEASKTNESGETKTLPVVCKLSNTLDILSDEEEEPPKVDQKTSDAPEKQCIDIDDDDDIMLIEDDSSHSKELVENDLGKESKVEDSPTSPTTKTDLETGEKETIPIDITETTKIEDTVNEEATKTDEKAEPADEKKSENEDKLEVEVEKPLLPEKFLKTAKKNLGEMTRDELEDFCIMKIVESLVDRSGLGEIKNKMKVMARNLEEYRKKAMLLTKQNRDLQVVLKSVQEEQKKRSNVIQPLKITRSVGMQVLMTDKPNPRRQGPIPSQTPNRPVRSTTQQNKNANKAPGAIPFPRLVPANNTANKTPVNSPAKNGSPNGMRTPSPATIAKAPEKRTQTRMQSSSSVTVDLTDDEPPAKVTKSKPGPLPPVRLVPPQNLMQPKGQPFANNNSNTPRKVYIPISGPQQQSIRPGQALMIKSMPTASTPGPRARMPAPQGGRTPANTFKIQDKLRHPAALPEAVKQYTPATWKPLPPAPDLKLSKVENGIVISWKIDGIPESAYETVASYQLYAYQETSSPPSTSLWKKIGDVKALPLPMACTLTQFMAGFKYYFAVRAVDIRSRLGPFSVPGSILLLSKV